MKIKSFLLFFVLFLLMNSDNIFAASESEAATKVEVPVLNAKEQRKLEMCIYFENIPEDGRGRLITYHGNLLSVAVLYAKSYPRIVDYVLATQPKLTNNADANGKYPFEKATDDLSLFNKLLQRTDSKHITVPRLSNVLSAVTSNTNNIEFAQQLANLGAQVNPQALKQATNQNHLDMMLWLIEKGVRDKDGDAIREITSPDALNILRLRAGADIRELDKHPNANESWLYAQTHYLSGNAWKQVNPELINTVLRMLKANTPLSSLNRPKYSNKTPLCKALEVITSQKRTIKPQAKEKARQVAHILLDYGAVCEDPELQTTLKEIKAERVSPEIADTMKGSEDSLPNAVIGLINEYTGAKLPTTTKAPEEDPALLKLRRAQAKETAATKTTPASASTSALAQPTSASSSATPARVMGGVVMSPATLPTYVSPRSTQSTQSESSVKGLDE